MTVTVNYEETKTPVGGDTSFNYLHEFMAGCFLILRPMEKSVGT